MFYTSASHTPESLAGACAVADALGPDTRRSLCRSLCTAWLKGYVSAAFSATRCLVSAVAAVKAVAALLRSSL